MSVLSGKFANVQGLNVYYETIGEGEPLLLLHAGIADHRMWEQNLPELVQQYQVIMFDIPGFGRTELAEVTFSQHGVVAGLLDHVGVEAAHVVGISYGGRIAIDFALAYPERVNKLVLGAPSVGGEAYSERIQAFGAEEDALLEADDLAGATELNLRLWVDGIHRRPEEVDPAVRQLVYTMQFEAFQVDEPEGVGMTGLEPAAIGRLAEITAETLLIIGDLDLPEKLTLADKITAEVPNSKKVIIPNTAHMMSMEAPEQFNQAVIEFLAK